VTQRSKKKYLKQTIFNFRFWLWMPPGAGGPRAWQNLHTQLLRHWRPWFSLCCRESVYYGIFPTDELVVDSTFIRPISNFAFVVVEAFRQFLWLRCSIYCLQPASSDNNSPSPPHLLSILYSVSVAGGVVYLSVTYTLLPYWVPPLCTYI